MIKRILATGTLLLAAQFASAQDVITLRVHHFLTAESPVHREVILPWTERLSAASGGRLRFEVYPDMKLGGTAAELYDQARDGKVDIVWTLPSYNPGRFPRIEVFELPFMMTDRKATCRAAWQFQRQFAGDEFGEVHVLSVHTIGPSLLFMRQLVTVHTLEDLKGRKLRAPSRLSRQLVTALGGVPIDTPAARTREQLADGSLDGALLTWDFAGASRSYEVARSVSEPAPSMPALSTSVVVFAMNKTRYESLPTDLRRLLDADSGLPLAEWIGGVLGANEAPWRERVAATGSAIHTIPEAEMKRWQVAARPVEDAWVRDLAAQQIDGRALLAAARDLIAQATTK